MFLYRFRALSDPTDADRVQQLRWEIVERGVFFQSPLMMNDPYDCFCRFDFGGTKEQRKRTLQYLVDHAPEERVRDSGLTSHQFAQRVLDRMSEKGRDQLAVDYHAVFSRRGVCCFTSDPRSILMWAHYASGHRGICLVYEIDPGLAESGYLHRVKYSHEPPTMCLYEYDSFSGDHHERWGKLAASTKFSHWSYENEWRLLSKKVGPMTEKEFVGVKLVGIIRGANMPSESRKLIRQFVNDRPTRVFDATRDFNRYQVNIRRLPRA